MPNSRKLLIAEDNAALAAVLKFNLERAGHDVSVAKSGTAAWELVQQNEFELIVTDHQMPGMSGVELCEKIRETESLKDTPIIMLTAKSLELDSDVILDQLKVQSILAKPFSPNQIVQQVGQVFSTPVS